MISLKRLLSRLQKSPNWEISEQRRVKWLSSLSFDSTLSRFIPSREFIEHTTFQLVSVGIATVPPPARRFAVLESMRSSMLPGTIYSIIGAGRQGTQINLSGADSFMNIFANLPECSTPGFSGKYVFRKNQTTSSMVSTELEGA